MRTPPAENMGSPVAANAVAMIDPTAAAARKARPIT
jgi:hypothetical protein